MRVLHVSAYYAPAFVYGGPPRSIHGLCRALRDHGVDAQVFTTDANGEGSLPEAVIAGGAYDGVPVRYFARSWPSEPIGSNALTRALRAELHKFDLVHIHGLWNRVVWSAARQARRTHVPYVLSPRGMLEPGAMAHRALRKRLAWTVIERTTIEGAALLHATSEAELRTLQVLRPDAEIVCVPNGVDPFPARPRIGAVRPVIAFIGRVHPLKRLDLLVDAFVRLRKANREAELVIAGPDEAKLRRALAARAGSFASEITWLGAVDAVGKAELLARASALVLCSNSESFGLSVAEAMAAAVPVVVTRTCGWDEVQRERAGLIVEQRPEAIAEALMSVLENPAGAREMGERGRLLIERRYRWPAVSAALAQHYSHVVSARSTAGAV
jgi:glycosyltransferase involved in cell wall biosynthesis